MGFNVKIIACHYEHIYTRHCIHVSKNNAKWYWYNVIKFHSNSNAHDKRLTGVVASANYWNWVAKPWLGYHARASGFPLICTKIHTIYLRFILHLTWCLIEKRKLKVHWIIFSFIARPTHFHCSWSLSLVHNTAGQMDGDLYWQLLPLTYWNLIWLFCPPTSVIQWQNCGIWRLIALKVSGMTCIQV